MSLSNIGLLDACDDPDLFGLGLWPRQRDLLASVVAGPRIHVWAVGRRSGKSTMAGAVCLHSALFRPDLDEMVRRGETRFCVVVATKLDQARLVVASARSMVEESPLLAGMLEQGTEDQLTFRLPSGARTALRAFPCSSRGGRGWPISTLVMDEAAHFLSETEGPAVAGKVWEALVPSTAQFGREARIIVCSTPYGTDGLFASLYEKAVTGVLEDAAAQHATTAQVNPTIDAAFLDREEARDPDSYRSEYLAEFAGSGNAFLDMDRIAFGEGEHRPGDGIGWIAGLDPAFTGRDPFGVALVGRSKSEPRQLITGPIVGLRTRRPRSMEERRLVEDELMAQVIEVCQRFGARAVTDQHMSQAVKQRLQQAGVTCHIDAMTATSKTDAYQEMRTRLYDGTLLVQDDPDVKAELQRLRTRFTAGAAAVVNPRVGGSHGDQAQALAIAVRAHARFGPPAPLGWRPHDGAPALMSGLAGIERSTFQLRPTPAVVGGSAGPREPRGPARFGERTHIF